MRMSTAHCEIARVLRRVRKAQSAAIVPHLATVGKLLFCAASRMLVLLVAMSMYCSVEGTKGRKEVFGWAVGFALASSEGEFSLQHFTYL